MPHSNGYSLLRLLVLVSLLPLFVVAELPNCYRARCSHCTVAFIAQMCPQTCSNCPGEGGGGGGGLGVNGLKIRPAIAHQHRQPGSLPPNPNPNYGPGIVRYASANQEPQPLLSAAPINQWNPQQGGGGGGFAVARGAPVAHRLPSNPIDIDKQIKQISDDTGGGGGGAPQHPQPQQPFRGYPQYPNQQTVGFGQQQGGVPPPAPQQPQPPQPFNNIFQQPHQGQLFGQTPQFFPSQPQQQQSPIFNPFQQFFQPQNNKQHPPQPLFQPFTLAPPVTFAPLPPQPQLQQQQQLFPQQPTALFQQPQFQGQQQYLQQQQQPNPQQQQSQTAGAGGSYSSNAIPPPPSPPLALQSYGQGQPQQLGNYQVVDSSQRPKQIYSQVPPSSTPQAPPPPPPPPPPVQFLPQGPSQGQVLLPLTQPPTGTPQQQQQRPPVAPKYTVPPAYPSKNDYEGKGGKGYVQGTCPKPNWEPCIDKGLANERFRSCCQRLGDGCTQLCSYDQTLSTLQLAVLTGRCPISKVADMMVCASGYEDVTACCQAHGVFEPGFEHCRPYCNPSAGLPSANDGMTSLADKYRCLGKLNQIQRCFYISQKP